MTFTIGLDLSALDQGFKSHSYRGIGRYVRELSRYLLEQHDPAISIAPFDHSHYRLPKLVDSMLQRVPAGRQTLRQQIAYPLQLSTVARGKYQALHFPAHMDAPTWCSIPCVVTVLDLIPLVCADLYKAERPGWRYALARGLENRAIRNAKLLFAISESTAQDVHRILGIPRERIVVTPLGVDERFFVDPGVVDEQALRATLKLPPGRPIVVYVGGLDPRKNTTRMLKAFREVVRQCDALHRPLPVLAMVGRYNEERGYPKFRSSVQELGLGSDVIETGFLDDAALLRLFKVAALFLFPSLYEGFGLPPLEAMAAGVPVVSSRGSAMTETVGDAALTFEPTDIDQAVAAIMTVLENREVGARLKEAGPRQARRYTWQKTAEATLAGYKQLQGEMR